MSEENTTQAPGLVLPDDAAAADRVSATDRLLSFDAAGNPVTATASQLREYTAAGLATTEALTAALEGKVSLIPESLSEQLVPGEFWLGADGVKRQVYIRTFMGTLADSSTRLISSIDAAMLVQGYMVQTIHHMPFNAVFPFSNITTALQTVAIPYVTNNVLTIYTDASGKPVGSKYVATFKYTKA